MPMDLPLIAERAGRDPKAITRTKHAAEEFIAAAFAVNGKAAMEWMFAQVLANAYTGPAEDRLVEAVVQFLAENGEQIRRRAAMGVEKQSA